MAREMYEFRLHGRGGQGIVMAASVFAEAVFLEGYFARAFSLFGAERRGAPVTAFIRVSRERLMPRSRIYYPDYVIVFDSTLAGSTFTAGLKESGKMVINAGENWKDALQAADREARGFNVFNVNATAIAWEHGLAIGSFPMVNTVMLGATARVSGLASLDNLVTAIEKRVASRVEDNISAAGDGYESVKEVGRLVT